MTEPVPAPVTDWLTAGEVSPLDEKVVPGATEGERSALAALGGLAHSFNEAEPSLLPDEVWTWFADGPKPPACVVNAAREWVSVDPDGALANLYATLVSGDNRRMLGTFFTPSEEARLMLEMWSDTQMDPDEVVDIGAGVGVFTAAARSAWQLARVVAVDINPVTLGLLALHPEVAANLRAPSDSRPGIDLTLDDFTHWVDTHESSHEKRLYLGNPPYTRAQLLPRSERIRLHNLVGDLCGTRSSLSTAITALCLKRLRPPDGICLLLPAQWLESDYARLLRRHIWNLRRRRIELRLVSSQLFADAQVDAVALLVGAEQEAVQPLKIGGFDGELRAVDRKVESPSNWRTIFAHLERPVIRPLDPDLVTLNDLAQVRRGMATGANAFFLLSEAFTRELSLPSDVLRPVVRRLHTFGDGVPSTPSYWYSDGDSTEPRFALVATHEDREKFSHLDAYLKYGENEGFDDRELCRRRDPWFDLNREAFIPDVIITAMTRGGFRVVTNDARAIITNNLYGWTWRSTVPESTQSSVISWLRSDDGQNALRQVSRSQADGLRKLEPKALRNLTLPVPPDD